MKIRTAIAISLVVLASCCSIRFMIYPIFNPGPPAEVSESELFYAGEDHDGEHWYWVFKEEAMDWLPQLTSVASLIIAFFIKPKRKGGE